MVWYYHDWIKTQSVVIVLSSDGLEPVIMKSEAKDMDSKEDDFGCGG